MLTLQPAMLGDRLPYPLHVQADGTIDRQDFWRGDPFRVIGLTLRPVPGDDLLEWREVESPDEIVGSYLVVTDVHGQWSTMTNRIGKVIDRDTGQQWGEV